MSRATKVPYQALFAEAGGLAVGNPVTRSGVKVGTVSRVSLRGKAVLVDLRRESHVPSGSHTTAHIQTGTLLGQRVLTLESAGGGRLHPQEMSSRSYRTSSPYTLTEAISDLTTNAAGTDTASLNQSLDTLSTMLDQIAPQIGPTFDGLSRPVAVINSRNDTLRKLLKRRQRHRDPLPTQRTTEHTDPQRQRPTRRVRSIAARPSSNCWPTPRRWPRN